VVNRPKQRVFEPVPELVTGRYRIGKGMKGEEGKSFRVLNLVGKAANNGGVIQVAALRSAGH
jgi:hypothetical protein